MPMFNSGWGTGDSYDCGYGSNGSQGLGFFERLKMQRRQRKEALKQQKLQQKEQMRAMKQQNKFQLLETKKGLNSGFGSFGGFGGSFGYGGGFGSGYDYDGYGRYGGSGYSGYQDTYRQQRGFLGGLFRRRGRQEEYYGDEYDNYPQNPHSQVRTQRRRRQADYEEEEEVPKSKTAIVAEKIASIGEKGKSALKKQQPVKVIDLAYDGCIKSGDYISAACEVVE